jgi:N-acetyl-beta-hexosaminidase
LLNWHKTTITRSLTQKPHDVAELQAPSSFYFAIDYIGMQGQLWSELIRTTEQLEYMTFPRLQALAERAWHRALWEKTDEVGIVLDIHAELNFYSVSSLKQQSVCRHVSPLGHIILIPSQPVFALCFLMLRA